MSSHHFIREGQEPALLVAGAVPYQAAEGLLQWAPLILVYEENLEHVLSWGVKPDVVILSTPPDNSLMELIQPFEPLEMVIAEGAHSMLETAFSVLDQHDQADVTILCSEAHAMMQVLPSLNGHHIVLQDSRFRWTRHDHEYTKWLAAGTVIELVRTNDQQDILIAGARATENSFCPEKDGIVHISSAHPFWVGVPY